jgi:hypothetical protein
MKEDHFPVYHRQAHSGILARSSQCLGDDSKRGHPRWIVDNPRPLLERAWFIPGRLGLDREARVLDDVQAAYGRGAAFLSSGYVMIGGGVAGI